MSRKLSAASRLHEDYRPLKAEVDLLRRQCLGLERLPDLHEEEGSPITPESVPARRSNTYTCDLPSSGRWSPLNRPDISYRVILINTGLSKCVTLRRRFLLLPKSNQNTGSYCALAAPLACSASRLSVPPVAAASPRRRAPRRARRRGRSRSWRPRASRRRRRPRSGLHSNKIS